MTRKKDPPGPSAPRASGPPRVESPHFEPPRAEPPRAEPPRPNRFVHHLPRAGLIVFLIAIVIAFQAVLLPFVLAIFFAYLIYPIVSRLERIPIGQRHPPRWVAVITVYALLFTLGWFGVPPLVGNLSTQVRTLASDLPSHFQWVQKQRKTVDDWIAGKLEVDHLSAPAPEMIFDDVEALAIGTLEPLPVGDGNEALLLPAPKISEPPPPKADAAQPTVVQLFAINIHLPGSAGSSEEAANATRIADPAASDHTPADHGTAANQGGPEEPSEGVATPPVESSTIDAAKPRRFSEERGRAFKSELRDAINAELKKPGPAKSVAAKVEREIVPALAKKHLEIPEDDRDLAVLARNTSVRVRDAVKQEDYAAVFNAYIVAGLETARRWVQEELAGLLGWVTGLAHGIFDFFMVLMLTAFFLVFFPTIRDYLRDLVAPQYREDYGQVLKRIDVRLSGAIRGQVIICMVNAALTFPCLWLIGTHTNATNLASYSVLLSMLAGVLSMIPIFGVILSTVPMVILALTQGSIGGALLVIAAISGIHAIEAYILNPNILGHSASMNPIIVVFALLAGRNAGGMLGALLAVPVASVLVSLFGYYRRLVASGHGPGSGSTAPADRWDD